MTKASYWKSQELVMIGVFAAAIKLSTVLIALAGGGMNPISLVLKNVVFTTLLLVLLIKVRKSGTLVLFSFVSLIVSVLLLGGSVTLLPAAVVGALAGEAAILAVGGIQKRWAPFVGVAVYDLVGKLFSLGMSYLMMRETPGLMLTVIPIVALGYVGALIGLWTGHKMIRELRHAGIVRS